MNGACNFGFRQFLFWASSGLEISAMVPVVPLEGSGSLRWNCNSLVLRLQKNSFLNKTKEWVLIGHRLLLLWDAKLSNMCASEAKVNGSCFLHLADGRGWVFETKARFGIEGA